MARLYHKAYRRGGGRRGGFKKASPDPYYSYATWPAKQSLPSTSEPSYQGSVTDPWWSTQTVTKITTNSSPFPTSAPSDNPLLKYSRGPIESGGYVIAVGHWTPDILQRSDWSVVVSNTSSLSQRICWPSRVNPGRLWTKSDGDVSGSQNFGYYPDMGTMTGFVSVWNPTSTYVWLDCPTAGEWAMDANEEYAAFTAKRVSDGVWEIICVRLSDQTVLGQYDTGTTTNPVDSLCMSVTGEYVVVWMSSAGGGLSQGNNIFNRSMTHQRNITSTGTNHVDVGVLEDGLTDVLGAVGGTDNEVYYVRLSDGVKVTVINGTDSSQNMWRWNTHVSMKSYSRPGYIYVCTYDTNMVSFSAYKGHNSVTAVRLATGEIEGWCCTQHSESDDYGYSYSAFACPNFDGKRVYFSSAWRRLYSSTASSHIPQGFVAERL